MKQDEIIEMAREAGFVDYELDDGTTNAFDKRYETFASLVAAKEREALAQEQEPEIKTTDPFESSRVADYNRGWNDCLFASGIMKQPEQEPMAWMNDSTPSGIFARHTEGAKNFGCTIPLYTTPPQRTWAGLTNEEKSGFNQHEMAVVKYVSKVLQEKNT